MKLILLFTTFPVRSETFLQREVSALQKAGCALEWWSLWGGARAFAGMPVRCASFASLLGLFWWLPYWLLRRPRKMGRVLRALLQLRWRNGTNYGENLLGLGLGVVHARRMEQENGANALLHAVWATLPAAYGWTVAQLTGLPFSFAGHAYDLFENGGDGLLPPKISLARGIRTSTQAGADRLVELGAPRARIAVIRRGLEAFPPLAPMRAKRTPVRLVVVGRFVPKMGFALLGAVFDVLVTRKVAFAARIIGDGPGRNAFEARRAASPWADEVTLLGAQPYAGVEETLRWGDLLLFTGCVAASGDRAGLPNIVGEAMAQGRPVLATPVGAVREAVQDGATGRIVRTPEDFAGAIDRLAQDDETYAGLAQRARAWAEAEFDAHRNMATFRRWIDEILA